MFEAEANLACFILQTFALGMNKQKKKFLGVDGVLAGIGNGHVWSANIQTLKNSRIQEFKISRFQEFKNSRIQELKN